MTHPGEMTCRELVELVNRYLEGDMGAEERQVFEEHLAFCEGCENYVRQMKQTVKVVGTLKEEQIPAPALDKLMHTFRDWKKQVPAKGAG